LLPEVFAAREGEKEEERGERMRREVERAKDPFVVSSLFFFSAGD
jgi:hypothetical protein